MTSAKPTLLYIDDDATLARLVDRGLSRLGLKVVHAASGTAGLDRLKQGDILVCQITNPTWAPIFPKISAAVSDIGGSMSHAAIVAREYGLPAVVGTGMATSKIPDGARIRVDGGRGVVTILQ